jgi:hypothetical protein
VIIGEDQEMEKSTMLFTLIFNDRTCIDDF